MSELVDRVHGQIGRLLHRGYGPGHRLPAQRTLAEMCGVSQTVVKLALKKLRKEGVIRTVRGRGSFVKHGGPLLGAKHQYGVYFLENPIDLLGEETFSARILIALRNRLNAERCSLLAIGRENPVSHTTPQGFETHPEEIPWNRIDGLFVLGFYAARTLSHPRLRAGPVLVLDQDARASGLDSVAFDDELAGELAARHLLGLGHRRLGLIEQASPAGFPYDAAWVLRRTSFERTILSCGGALYPDWRLPWDLFGPGPLGGEAWRERLRALVERPPASRPTAIFSPDTEVMETIREFLKSIGHPPPKTFSLVGVGNTPFKQAPPPAGAGPTRLALDPGELGQRAVDAMLEVLRLGPPSSERPPRLWLAPPRLVEGTTSCQCVDS